MTADHVIHDGHGGPAIARIDLCAGPLTMVFEPGTGFLRYVRLGDREVLRGIYAAVRDHNWGTVEPDITDLAHDGSSNAFRLTFTATCSAAEIDFVWKGTITGSEAGVATFTMDGSARSIFLRNRIGFCVLHPASAAGAACRVRHVDGVLEEGDLPEAIAPHQPFMGMQAISHEVMPGVWAEVRFEGDVFEMEDQRNWTDASFKTYCTPLDLPFPVRITEGSQIRQSIRLSVSDGVPPTRATGVTQTEEVVLALRDAPPVRLPRIGLGSASHGETLTELEVARLRKLDLGHLRVDLWMEEEGWEDVLRAASAEAGALGVGLEAALYLSDSSGDALGRLRGALDDLHPKIARWLVFDAMTRHTEVGEVLLARRHLAAYDPDAPIGGGTDAYFTELNRQRPPTESLDLVCYSLNPQVHAFDDASIVETLEAQGTTVQSARGFVGGLPVAVSPVTMKPRFNPNATGEALDSPPGTLPPEADARQISLLGAGWTLGSIKYLSESGVSSITYYETTGWRGTMETEAGSSLPDAFPSTPGTVFPLYHVLADVGEFSGGVMLPGRSTRPLDVDGLVLRSRDRVRVLLANLSAQDQRVRIECDGMGSRVRVSRLDAHTAQRAMSDPEAYRAEQGIEEQVRDGVFGLSLPPHGLVRIDCEEKADG